MLNITLKEPSYEVILPMSGYKILLKPITAKIEQDILLSKISTFSSRLKKTLEIFWDRVDNKDLFNNSFDTFITNIYEQDLDMIAYGILCATYLNKEVTLDLTCPKCGETNTIPIKIESVFDPTKTNINTNGLDVRTELKKEMFFPEYGLTFKLRPHNMKEFMFAVDLFEKHSNMNLAESVNISDIDTMLIKLDLIAVGLLVDEIIDANNNVTKIDIINDQNTFMEFVNFIESNISSNVISNIAGYIKTIPFKAGFSAKFMCSNPNCPSKNNEDIIKQFVSVELDLTSSFFPL